MKTIHKFHLTNIDGKFGIFETLMNDGAKILKVGVQDKAFTVWAEVDMHREVHRRRFIIRPTGGDVPGGEYLDTVFVDWTVWHIYDRGFMV